MAARCRPATVRSGAGRPGTSRRQARGADIPDGVNDVAEEPQDEYLTERRPEALDAFGKIVQQNPNFVPAHAYRAVLFSELGRVKEAREAWAKASHLSPGASMPDLRERLPYKRPADLDRFLTAARRAGMQ